MVRVVEEMKYAIYFTWKVDGMKDTFNVNNAKERDYNIKLMIQEGYTKDIHYCPIYKSGEYGRRMFI